MKYLKQVGIILGFSLIGEILHYFIPLPVPAGIYGIVLLFLALECKVVPLHAVEEAGQFLVEIMPVMFIPAAVGLLDSWGILKDSWIQYLIVTVVTTIVVMAVSGLVTQAVIRVKKKKKDGNQ